MAGQTVLLVDEDRSRPVTRETYRAIEDSSEVVDLLEAGVFSLVRSRRTPYGIKASAWVGQALIGGSIHLVVREKVAGTLEGLLRHALPDDIRIAASSSPVGAGVAFVGVLCRLFLDELELAIRYGRDRHYIARADTGPSLRGRLEVPKTITLRMAGRRDLLAYTRSELTADTLVNRSIALALRGVDTYATSVGATEQKLAVRAREWQILFSDARIDHIARAGRDSQRRTFEAALADPAVEGNLRRGLLYAQAIVLNYGLWPAESSAITGEVPAAFFVNLSDLFEDAVRGALRSWIPPNLIRMGSELAIQVLPNLLGRYTVDPDFVVDLPDGRLVGDCKYKVDEKPAHADLYQLLTHARALGATSSMLVYAGETAYQYELGRTSEGLPVYVVSARATSLALDLKVACEALGLAAATTPAG